MSNKTRHHKARRRAAALALPLALAMGACADTESDASRPGALGAPEEVVGVIEALPNDPLAGYARETREDFYDSDKVVASMPEGTRIEVEPDTWVPATSNAGTLTAAITWPGNEASAHYLVTMVREEGSAWKVAAIVGVPMN